MFFFKVFGLVYNYVFGVRIFFLIYRFFRFFIKAVGFGIGEMVVELGLFFERFRFRV